MELQNPLIGGFNPDPSILFHEGTYYLVTSTFEYLPGIPIYASTDLKNWTLLSHVVTRSDQLKLHGVPTGGGVWAPTIRQQDGIFYVVVTEAMGRGTLIFTANNPAGPWDGGTVVEVDGIDPDIAWDENGVCYMTYSGLTPETGKHLGIQQAKIDPKTGKRLEEPRSMWSGTGLMFPEAPHLYKIDKYWYLLIAEGGTERGHAVSIARGPSIEGPFEASPHSPFLSARSTSRTIQNTGHGDLFLAHDGNWYLVLLGMHIRGLTRSFSSLGRETFITPITWRDGWPHAEPVTPSGDANTRTYVKDFTREEITGEMIAIRRMPQAVATKSAAGLTLTGKGQTMDSPNPEFVGKRQEILFGEIELDASYTGIGGLTLRYDENAHFDVEVTSDSIIARARLAFLNHEEKVVRPAGLNRLRTFMKFYEPIAGYDTSMTSDLVDLGYFDKDGNPIVIATYDGRYLSAEVTCSFTGRVFGVYSVDGDLTIHTLSETPA
jgi:beta-xylosidase